VDWVNCSGNVQVSHLGRSACVTNYYNAVCPQGVQVYSYQEVIYRNLYSGITLRWHSEDGDLKYDYLVDAGADYSQIQLKFSGQQELSIDRRGNLVISTPFGDLVEEAPLVYQDGKPLSAGWVLNGQVASFSIVGADPSQALVIDPLVRAWASYYGGVGNDVTGKGCTDSQGNVYITGNTSTPTHLNLATSGAHQTTYGGGFGGSVPGDAFVAKFNSSGVRLWATYYGGTGSDFGNQVVADASQNCYMVGGSHSTGSGVIATSGAYQVTMNGGPNIGDAMIVKFDANGVRLWGTYYGDNDDDWAMAITLDPSGANIYVSGGTLNGTMQAMGSPGSHQQAHATGTANVDAFLAKFTSGGSRVWSTYYGDTGTDNGLGCASDGLGNVYLTGITTSSVSSLMATPGSHQPVFGGNGPPFGNGDAFLAKFDPTGVRLWGTYYGGTADDYSGACSVDGNGDVYIAGNTASAGGTVIATLSSPQPAFGGNYDAFLAKFSGNGTRLWGTYCGVSTVEDWSHCAVDAVNNVYLCGQAASSSSVPIATPCSYQSAGGGQIDAFLVKYASSGQKLWSTYYGGPGIEEGVGVFSNGSSLYLTGASFGSGTVISTPGSHQPNYIGGSHDCFMVKFDPCQPATPAVSVLGVVCPGRPAALSATNACSLAWYADQGGTFVLHSGTTYTSGPLQSDTTIYVADLSCGSPGPISAVQVTLAPTPTITIQSDRPVICVGESTSLEAQGAVSYTWTAPFQTGAILSVIPATNTIYQVTGTDVNGCTSQKSYTIQVYECSGLGEHSALSRLSIFPQPASESFVVKGDRAMDLKIFTLTGQLVSDIELSDNNTFTATVSDLNPGVYLLSTADAAHTRKVVVLK
jgi:hypothetical protein